MSAPSGADDAAARAEASWGLAWHRILVRHPALAVVGCTPRLARRDAEQWRLTCLQRAAAHGVSPHAAREMCAYAWVSAQRALDRIEEETGHRLRPRTPEASTGSPREALPGAGRPPRPAQPPVAPPTWAPEHEELANWLALLPPGPRVDALAGSLPELPLDRSSWQFWAPRDGRPEPAPLGAAGSGSSSSGQPVPAVAAHAGSGPGAGSAAGEAEAGIVWAHAWGQLQGEQPQLAALWETPRSYATITEWTQVCVGHLVRRGLSPSKAHEWSAVIWYWALELFEEIRERTGYQLWAHASPRPLPGDGGPSQARGAHSGAPTPDPWEAY